MPFTPTILKEDFNKYILNPKKITSKFMAMAFNTTYLGQKNSSCNTSSRLYC